MRSDTCDHLRDYLLHLADSTLILTQRNAAWCGHGPILEQDIAITNITLDLIGQSRNFYQYAAVLIAKQGNSKEPVTEDSLAYLRTERAFKNLLLTELPNGDWAQTIIRQFFFTNFQSLLFRRLSESKDERLAGIAVKALKEIAYHLTWTRDWVLRLGDGTEESNRRMQHALQELWPYTAEMFTPAEYEVALSAEGIAPDPASLKEAWLENIAEIFSQANIPFETYRTQDGLMQRGGKHGVHTEHLGYILAEMQYLQRTYPGAEW